MILINQKEVEFLTFPNGETNIIQQSIDFRNLKNEQNLISFKYENDGDLVKLMFVKSYLDQLNLRDTILLVYYLPYSRMDRIEENSAFTLKYITTFVNNMDFCKVVIIEPHSDVSPALINNSESAILSYDLFDMVKRETGFVEDIDTIMFPDLGAMSRLKDMRYKNTLIGHKARDFKTGEILHLEIIGEKLPESKRAYIIDDLSSRGGTFVYSSLKLKELGFEEVFLVVIHSENTIFKGELFQHIDHVFTTDTILTEQDHWENRKYKKQLQIYKIQDIYTH